MLAAILRAHAGEAAVLATRGNLNTDIGVPLTLLRLRRAHGWCAIELGMNHPGEIAALAAIAQPTIALVNNAQREHLEFMRTVEAVAAENAAVFGALPPDGVAVINADDPQAEYFRPIGCDACDHSGFRGRAGLFEVVEVGDEVRRLVANHASPDQIRSVVRARGTPTLADEGLAAVRAGTTTANELARSVHMTSVPRPLCLGCGLAVESDYVACPRCGRRQHAPCGRCGRALQPGWRVCPYCERASPTAG